MSASRTGHAIRRAAVAACAAVLVLGLLAACSEQKRYEVLTVIFTGVPPPGGVAGTGEGEGEAGYVPPAARDVVVAENFIHGPFGAARCELCHALKGTASFSDAKDKVQGGGSSMPRFGTRLLEPREKLCLGCHARLGPEASTRQGHWQHGPVGSGNCLICHSPHESPRQYMLKEDASTLCLDCHSEKGPGDARARWIHGPVATGECITCHAPHGGPYAFFLPTPTTTEMCTGCHRPADLARNESHPPPPLPECASCHDPHGGDEQFFLKWG